MTRRPRCWCGVYVDCHQRITHKPRRAPRAWLWYRDHSLWQHLAAPVWLRLPEKLRWDIVHRLDRSERRCWSELVSDALTYRERDHCDTRVPAVFPRGTRCASICDWSHPDHAGVHPCHCYCGKFQFTAPNGAIDRKAGR